MSKKFATLSDTKKKEAESSDSGNEDSDANRRQAFYVGGSDKSGQQVLGPSKPQSDDIINNLFRSAREHGAEAFDRSQQPQQAGASAGSSGFTGAGIRLGDHVTGSSIAASGKPTDGGIPDREPRTVQVVIQMWRNGFVVDDGPLRPYDDPESRQFLESIMQNRIPAELLTKHRGAFIELDLENHKNDNYRPPKVDAKPFQGAGYTLGSPAPTVTGSNNSVNNKPETQSQSAAAAAAAAAVGNFDSSKPTTNIQIRLADGGRLVAQFNHTHRISDIRSYIISAHPSSASNSNFVLMTNFPKQELTDETKTLAEAGLLNAVVVQHFKQNK